MLRNIIPRPPSRPGRLGKFVSISLFFIFFFLFYSGPGDFLYSILFSLTSLVWLWLTYVMVTTLRVPSLFCFLILVASTIALTPELYNMCITSLAGGEARAIRDHLTLAYPFVVLIPTYNRPVYLIQVLEGIRGCNGSNNVLVVVSVDGSHEETVQLLDEWSDPNKGHIHLIYYKHMRDFLSFLPSYFVRTWAKEHSLSRNIKSLLDFAFITLSSPAAVLLEDDIVPSPDALDYFAWTARAILFNTSHPEALTISGYNDSTTPLSRPYVLYTRQFMSWGWMMARHVYLHVARPRWEVLLRDWDINLSGIGKQMGLVTYEPERGRTVHIGKTGVHYVGAPLNLYIANGTVLYDGRFPEFE